MRRLGRRISLTVALAAVLGALAALWQVSAIAAVAATPAANAATTAPASPGSMLQVMTGLLLVLGVLVAAAWGLKKFGAGKHANPGAIRVVGGLPVGNRERILVVEVADQWIVVGVTPTTITALSTMPKQDSLPTHSAVPQTKNFATWLQHTIDLRHAARKSPSGSDNAA